MEYLQMKYSSEVKTMLLDGKTEFSDETTSQLLIEWKDDYVMRAKEIIGNESSNSDLFSWLTNHMNIWIAICSSTHEFYYVMVFAEKNNESTDRILIKDLVEVTNDIKFKLMKNKEDKLKYLIDKNLLQNIHPENIIFSSIDEETSLFLYTRYWIDKEYRTATSSLAYNPINSINFNELRIHADKYQFKEMITDIEDKQFSAELFECLAAYENEQFYVCAAGLGGVLEHLMFLTLEKNKMLDRNFPDNATYHDYVSYFGRAPIKLDRRQKNFIKSIFMIRNSVSHFNSGFTGKENCQSLMSGIKNIYANYYSQDYSLETND